MTRAPLATGPTLEEKDPYKIGPFKFNPKWVQKPYSDSYFKWLVVISCSVWYNLILTVPRAVFHEIHEGNQLYFFLCVDYLCDLLYLVDMGIKMITGYFENGILIREPRKLMAAYKKSSVFVWDIISILPTDLFYFATGWYAPYPIFRINRIFRLSRTHDFYYRAQTRLDSPNTFRLIYLILTMIVVVHLNACVYYWVSAQVGIGLDRWAYPGRAGWRYQEGGHGGGHGAGGHEAGGHEAGSHGAGGHATGDHGGNSTVHQLHDLHELPHGIHELPHGIGAARGSENDTVADHLNTTFGHELPDSLTHHENFSVTGEATEHSSEPAIHESATHEAHASDHNPQEDRAPIGPDKSPHQDIDNEFLPPSRQPGRFGSNRNLKFTIADSPKSIVISNNSFVPVSVLPAHHSRRRRQVLAHKETDIDFYGLLNSTTIAHVTVTVHGSSEFGPVDLSVSAFGSERPKIIANADSSAKISHRLPNAQSESTRANNPIRSQSETTTANIPLFQLTNSVIPDLPGFPNHHSTESIPDSVIRTIKRSVPDSTIAHSTTTASQDHEAPDHRREVHLPNGSSISASHAAATRETAPAVTENRLRALERQLNAEFDLQTSERTAVPETSTPQAVHHIDSHGVDTGKQANGNAHVLQPSGNKEVGTSGNHNEPSAHPVSDMSHSGSGTEGQDHGQAASGPSDAHGSAETASEHEPSASDNVHSGADHVEQVPAAHGEAAHSTSQGSHSPANHQTTGHENTDGHSEASSHGEGTGHGEGASHSTGPNAEGAVHGSVEGHGAGTGGHGETGGHGAGAHAETGGHGNASEHGDTGGHGGDGHASAGHSDAHGDSAAGHGAAGHGATAGEHGAAAGGHAEGAAPAGGGHHKPIEVSERFVNDTLLQKYSYCLYWSVKMMTSKPYELANPTTTIEFAFHIFDAFLGIFMFASIVSEVDGIIERINKASDDFKEKLDSVKQYISMRKVGREMESRVVKWFDYVWANNGSLDEDSALAVLPAYLRMEIARFVHLDVLKKVPIFQGIDEQFLLELAEKLRFEAFCPGDYVCRKGDIGREIYVVRRGLLNVIAADGVKVIVTLKSGVVFGELSLLNVPGSANGNRRTVTVRTVGYADLFSLSKEAFWTCLEEYPDVKEQLMEKARKILQKDNLYNDEAARDAARRGRNFEEVAGRLEENLDIMTRRLGRFWQDQIEINQSLLTKLERLETLRRQQRKKQNKLREVGDLLDLSQDIAGGAAAP